MSSGEVARAAGVNLQTLRYYERRGLLPEPERSLGGHRRYDPEAVTTLRVIKAAQRLGFTLSEVAELLEVGHDHGHRSPGLQARARGKLAETEQRMADLGLIGDTLQQVIDAGCDDLAACAQGDCCPVPFAALATDADGPAGGQRC